jgi:hypothetical protein
MRIKGFNKEGSPPSNGSGEDQVQGNKGQRKKRIAATSSLLLILIIIVAVSLFKSSNSKVYKYNGEFVLMTKTEGGKMGLYLGIPGEDEVKLADDAEFQGQGYNYVKTGGSSRLYLYFNKEGQLCETDNKGNNESIASNVRRKSFTMSPDLSKYLFIAGDKDTLYLKDRDKDKIKIKEDVQSCFFLQDNETVLFQSNERELFIRRKNGDIDRLADDARYILFFDSSNGIAYSNYEGHTYYINVITGELKKLSDFSISVCGFDDRDLYYSKGTELYLLRNGKQEVKVGEDVWISKYLKDGVVYNTFEGKWYTVAKGSAKASPLPELKASNYLNYINDYIFYTDENNTLFRINIGTEEIEKIKEDVSNVFSAGKNVYFTVYDGGQTLYRLEKDGSVVKLQEGVVYVEVVDDSYLAYSTEDENLYIDGKSYSDVRGFVVAGENICYANSKEELFIIEGKSDPKKVSKDISQYDLIYFGGYQLNFINNSIKK